MSEQTKHERFVSEETLEQIANLIEPLSNHLGMPMMLLDAEANLFRQSANTPACSFAFAGKGSEESICRECREGLRDRLKTIYDAPIMEKCANGIEIIAVPIKIERQYLTKIKRQFIGMLCLTPLPHDGIGANVQTGDDRVYSMITLIETLLRQIAMRSQDLGELVSQLLESQNELTMSYRFSNAATRNMDIESLFQEALKLINSHIEPKEACIVVPSETNGFDEVARSGNLSDDRSKASLFSTRIYSQIVERSLQGLPVLINSDNGYSNAFVKSILAMPIRAGGDVFGAIILADKENGEMFLADDENFVTSLTNSLGMVLKHVKLAKEVVNAEKSSLDSQKEIVARVVHKMRNQFFAMQGNIKWVHQIFEESEIDRVALESALGRIDKNIDESSKIVSGFLEYIAPENYQPEDTDISSVVGEVVKNMREYIKSKGKEVLIEEEYASGLPQAKIDATRFGTVIQELIVNSTQHLNGDGRIMLRTALASDEEVKIAGGAKNGQYIAIEVSDNGPGIPDDIRQKIFNLGFSTRSMGTGLGLSLVKRDVERHKGKIVEIGEMGADFLIVLPASERV